MIVQAIYHGLNQIVRVYHNGEVIFQNSPIEFHLIEDGKLIIIGAMSAIQTADGVYLDCAPGEDTGGSGDGGENPGETPGGDSGGNSGDNTGGDDTGGSSEWIYPVKNGSVLTIGQVYSAIKNGNVLEVE